MLFRWIAPAVLAMLMVVSLPLQAFSGGWKPVESSRQWRGSVDDLSRLKAAPEFILSAGEFEALWKAWKVPGPVPEVDFSRDLVAVLTTQGSKLRFSATRDGRGNVKVWGLATRDLRPGFRYVMAVLSRKGVTTINGKDLTSKADQTSPATSSAQERADFGVSGIAVQSVQTLDPHKFNAEVAQAAGQGETWTREAVPVALKFVGEGIKGNAKIIEARTPPESQEVATITVTESGYPDDAIGGERWRLWLAQKAEGTWIITRAQWAQLCDRPGRRYYSAEKCP